MVFKKTNKKKRIKNFKQKNIYTKKLQKKKQLIKKNILLIEHDYGKVNRYSINYTTKILSNYVKNFQYFSQNLENNNINKNLNNIYNNIQDNNVFIGGDHSVSMATISKIYKPGMKIIWIDAHPDINTYRSSISKNVHGMPLAHLTGLDKITTNLKFLKSLPFKDILYIGIRSIDDYEKNIIEKKNVNFIDCSLMNYKKIIKRFLGNNKFHVSFDVDSIDPHDMPCTGTKACQGINKIMMRKLMDYLLTFNLNSLDIVELNLHIGSQDDYDTSLQTLFYIFKNYNLFNR